MKKGLTKFITVLLSVTLLFSVTACGGGEGTGNGGGGSTKTELKVYTYDGGVGHVWLEEVEKRFEAAFADKSFEAGKTGVDIIIDPKKNDADLSTIQNSNNDVFFSEWVDIPSLISQDRVLNIDDIVREPLNVILEGKTTDTSSIHDKLYPETQAYYSFRQDPATGANQYYALPHYSHFATFTYNHQLFEDKNLYFAKDAVGTSLAGKFIANDSQAKSCGPDGVYGTSDDGFPATYTELFDLFNYMKTECGVQPVSWGGSSASGYTKYILNMVYTNLAGKQDASYQYTFFSGEDTINIVTGFDSNGKPITGTAKVVQSDYSALSKQLEKYQAMYVYDQIIDNKEWQSSAAKDPTMDFSMTQGDFVISYNEGTPIGMLLEGTYWYNEADDANHLSDAEEGYADFWDKNDFRILPMPRVFEGTAKTVATLAEQGKVGKTVVTDNADSIACINAKIKNNEDKVKLAKMFLAFCYTQESLEEFNIVTRTPRFMNYTVDTSKLDAYAKNVYEYVQSSDLLLPYSGVQQFISNKKQYSLHVESNFWSANTQPYEGMQGEGKTAQTFFEKYAGL